MKGRDANKVFQRDIGSPDSSSSRFACAAYQGSEDSMSRQSSGPCKRICSVTCLGHRVNTLAVDDVVFGVMELSCFGVESDCIRTCIFVHLQVQIPCSKDYSGIGALLSA